jgi:hypothetical protein
MKAHLQVFKDKRERLDVHSMFLVPDTHMGRQKYTIYWELKIRTHITMFWKNYCIYESVKQELHLNAVRFMR